MSLKDRVKIAAGAAVWAMTQGPLKSSSFAEERAMRFQEWVSAHYPPKPMTDLAYQRAWERYAKRLEFVPVSVSGVIPNPR